MEGHAAPEAKLNCSLGLDGTFWVGDAQPGEARTLYCLQGAAQEKAWRQAHKKGVWIWQKRSKDATCKDAGPDLWFPFLGYPHFTFQALDLLGNPSNDFQKSSPSQPGQGTEPDPHQHRAARLLGARVPSALAGAAQC